VKSEFIFIISIVFSNQQILGYEEKSYDNFDYNDITNKFLMFYQKLEK
jgi:hypothetical protein